ncbi:LANO_0A03422g1_1 [Lachancea nothofagi CBS 11611]|uniref:LANO_0A03422g1_1 n=1 Tax=Lachancea nothofagi CBS 11611 TaxID=1266666 RepID=A0A1G4IPI6_9SACH|nr:LANO_0A03422g1_1 [Lachancea nothofagi CBS 11611]
MSNNLASYFGNERDSPNGVSGTSGVVAEDDDMGPSVSMAVEAENDEDFRRSTFNLKRTRSMGLLDGHSDSQTTDGTPMSGSASPEHDSNSPPMGPSESTSPPVPEAGNYLIPHDDNDIMHEPKRHVDYLSHQWNESEISQSWKYIILKKKRQNEDLVNAARLENASWRTWAKARNHLRTVSPEAVNWSKDSDVTWLYGPVVRQKSNDQAQGADEECGYGSDDETSKRLTTFKPKNRTSKGPKPILKKRTVSEIIEENSLWRLNVARQHKKNLSSTQAMMDGYGNHLDAADDYDVLAAKVNAQYYSSRPPSQPSPQFPNTHEGHGDDERHDNQLLQNQQQDTKSQHDDCLSAAAEEDIVNSEQASPNKSPTPALESILTSPSRKAPKAVCEQKDRHIHFNDRVEQCMALSFHSDDDDDDNESDDDSMDESGIEGSAHHEYPKVRKEQSRSGHKDLRQTSDSDQDLNSSSSDEEEAGLFINARLSRKSDGIHTPTDYASLSSEAGSSKSSITAPIIKFLPATTLNYGSDEEDYDDDDDYYGNNAVSHNVNTFRGYDYMYDYNSVYTGDTSSFMAVNNYDMVDVPEGLQTPIEEHEGQPMLSDQNSSESQLPSGPTGKKGFSLDSDTDSYGSNGESQFIEDSQVKGSDDDDEDLEGLPGLKRTSSLGLSNTTSLQNLNSSAPAIPQTHSFISGKPLRPANQPWDVSGDISTASKNLPVRSTKKFSFDSGSESDSNSDSDQGTKIGNEIKSTYKSGNSNENENVVELRSKASDSPRAESSSNKHVYKDPTRGTAVSPMPKSQEQKIPTGSLVSMVSSSGDSRTSLSDVAISGYISPRNESMQSVVAKEKMVDNDKSKFTDVDRMNKNLEDWHLESHDDSTDDAHPENVQKMMNSARDIANKYLHSWKK